MKKAALIYLIASIVVAIAVMLAIMLPMALFGEVPKDDDIQIYDDLVISSASATAIYDGTTLTNIEWHLVSGTLEVGHVLSVNVSGTQTDVGVSDNHISARIFDRNGMDVTNKYGIEYELGKLEVKPRELVIVADSAMKLYDGEPLTANGYKIDPSTPLPYNHVIKVNVTGSITEVGKTDNIISKVTIVNETKENVTSNYNITLVKGTLVVYDDKTLVFCSDSDTKIYDGIPLKNLIWTMVSGELNDGDVAEVEVTGIQIDVGESENTLSVRIVNEKGIDVTARYDILCVCGTLTVLRGEVVIYSNNDIKIYDGEPLTNDGYTITPENLQVSGISFDVVITGEQTEIGSSENTVESVKIYDVDHNDITHNFVVLIQNGVLRVVDSYGNEGGMLGGNLSGDMTEAGNNISGDTVIFKLLGTTKDTVYLKAQSYGDLNSAKNGWNEAKEYDVYMPGGKSAAYLTSEAIQNSGLVYSRLDIEPVFGIFALPYYSYNGKFNIQKSDVYVLGDFTAPYTVNYFNWNNYMGVELPSAYASYEKEYESFVRSNYLNVDSETLEFMQSIIQTEGFSSYDPAIIENVARYIKESASYNLKYNTAMDSEPNVVIAFLSEYKEGVCRHYASAATLLFRSLGIPARYTVGFVGNTLPGEETMVTAANAHAWVEVYVSGIGWVNVEVTAGGTGNSEVEELKLKPTYTGEQYQGRAITALQTVSGFERLAEKGYTYQAEITGRRTTYGITESEIVSFKIYDPSGELVYDKQGNIGDDKYDIEYEKGQVQLYIDELVFTSSSITKVYDGMPLAGTIDDYTLVSGMMSINDTCSITPSAQITNVGKVSNSYKVVVYRDGVDKTDYYKITKHYGILTVTAKDLDITAGSAQKPFDGSPLSYNGISYDQGLLADGDKIDYYFVEGSQTNIGEAANVVREIIITNKKGIDVTSNYSIKFIDGVLKVTIPK